MLQDPNIITSIKIITARSYTEDKREYEILMERVITFKQEYDLKTKERAELLKEQLLYESSDY